MTGQLAAVLASGAIHVARLSDRSGVVLDADGLEIYAVNETGMCLVEALRAGIDDREALVERVCGEFDVDEATAADDLDRFLRELTQCLRRHRGGSE
jgi:hypothetical protein